MCQRCKDLSLKHSKLQKERLRKKGICVICRVAKAQRDRFRCLACTELSARQARARYLKAKEKLNE
jgi:hypothetical protein